MIRAVSGAEERAEGLAERIESGALPGVAARRVPAAVAEPEPPWLPPVIAQLAEEFAAFRYTEARALVDGALGRLDRDGTAGTSPDDILELLLWRARIAEAVGDEFEADGAGRMALAVRPELEVDPARHPPSLAARIERARSEARTCRFDATLSPSEASLSVDGAPFGPAPATVGCGVHWIAARAPGYATRHRRVLVEPDLPLEALRLELEPSLALQAASQPGTAVPELWSQAARELGRELLVLDVVVDGEVLVVALGELRVQADASASDGEVIELLAALHRGTDDLDIPAIVGVSAGAGALVALAITVLVVVLTPSENGFAIRGEILP